MRIIGTMRALDGTRGAVRVEDVYDTDIDDLWKAMEGGWLTWSVHPVGTLVDRLSADLDALLSGWSARPGGVA